MIVDSYFEWLLGFVCSFDINEIFQMLILNGKSLSWTNIYYIEMKNQICLNYKDMLIAFAIINIDKL